ncbi:mdm2-binding protein isoform X2 [Protopterus annectens]|uniref:mdm2-binding protein isoform X2 n=1 Tax=Protopterus annectens TaxID=7888 RepID=UPI001CFC0FB6|nr:mdm2-binding protein isoform X2 [Protopterus annectens]
MLHQLADKLPPSGRALVDVIIHCSDSDAPRLKDCLPVLGVLKCLHAWHSAEISLATRNVKSWQKIAEFLSANAVDSDNLKNVIDPKILWRGKLQIRERKFASEIQFPNFCLKSVSSRNALKTLLALAISLAKKRMKETHAKNMLSEVFHYYGPVLEFVQIVLLSDLPSYFHSGRQFELSLSRSNIQGKSKLLLEQFSALKGRVGALFHLGCVVSNLNLSPANQLSMQKWKEYMSKKPKNILVPDVDIKGQNAGYYLLIQGSGRGGCKATLINSANQINGAAALAVVNGQLKDKKSDQATKLDVAGILKSMPCVQRDQLLERERRLCRFQTLILKELQKRQQVPNTASDIHVANIKPLLTLAREHYFKLSNVKPLKTSSQNADKENTFCSSAVQSYVQHSYLEGLERSVITNLENREKMKRKIRAGFIVSGSCESLLGPRENQKAQTSVLDAKELLKYFTPDGTPATELQPIQIQRGENVFTLTPNLTPWKVTQLHFKEASTCSYHGLEYCIDNKKAIERDRRMIRLQSRLIRYETQTTCTRECCPIPYALSPLPSPAVLSEPGSVPDGEMLQSEHRLEVARLKRKSRDFDGFHPNKRLTKSESTESLLSQASGSSGHHPSTLVSREGPPQLTVSIKLPSKQPEKVTTKLVQPQQQQSQGSKQNKHAAHQQTKESRSQKHTRMLKEVVAKTLCKHGISEDHERFSACSERLFEVSKLYLKDLKTSRGLHEEMKKAANNNVKQVIDWVLEKISK